ncbi:MAG: hypothetical protein K9J17_11700 [Flavobacteriales bacterium]|nr:hypothetical protein [Flavobacteriales bacterium]
MAQEADSVKKHMTVLERIELESLFSLHVGSGAKVGGGMQLGVHLPLYNGRLRLGIDAGFGRHNGAFKADNTTLNLQLNMVNLDLRVGTDLLAKHPVDLIVDVGARMFIPTNGLYNFQYYMPYIYADGHYFKIENRPVPAILCGLSFRMPVSFRSILTFSYSFSYTFLSVKPKANTESNGVYYSDQLENYFVTHPPAPYPPDGKQFEIPILGQVHYFRVGYCYRFALRK